MHEDSKDVNPHLNNSTFAVQVKSSEKYFVTS